MKRLYFIPALALFLFVVMTATTIVACGGEENVGDGRDTAAAPVDSNAAMIAEIDRVIGEYTVAADSLATLFDRLKTVEDVENASGKIRAWNGTIRNFQQQSARYGQPLLERMGVTGADSVLNHLVNARDSLRSKYPEAYTRVSQIEEETGNATGR